MSAEEVIKKSEGPPGDYDRLQNLFGRPFFLSLTIGVPFCIFKLIFGISAVRAGDMTTSLLSTAGWLIILWAGVDLLMNISRAGLDLVHRPARFEYCSIAQAGRYFRKPGLFLAFDTLLSFTIICFMLWSGWITTLTLNELWLWFAATTLNLISLSLVLLYNEMKRTDRVSYP
jgi:hypothetical protein